MKHKPIQRQLRERIWHKYDCHCAYCGCEISYKEMQVDHIHPLNGYDVVENPDDISNLNPACRMCNYYKGYSRLEEFRNNIKDTLLRTSVGTFQSRLAMKYGIIKVEPWDGKFYFEKYEHLLPNPQK